ncbi:PEP-utilizing enzyme [Thiofilum flexile]|uniref:PEP-utilizing enzyme n=1 Tax=Thiofilum flexile TaxID=125627 RepID=UPI00035C4DE5|nr:PEP-utilizing enzyme [Thiofilum flexile]
MNEQPNKYYYLQLAQEAGINTPASWLIDTIPTPVELENFTQKNQSDYYIVRSAVALEDGNTHSLAGHFWSSDKVNADQLAATIEYGFQANSERLKQQQSSINPTLMVQPFIEHTIGGVAFCPWSFFSNYSYVEYATTVQAVVEGNATPALISLDPNYSHPIEPENNVWIRPLQDTIQHLKGLFDFPLDIEWVFHHNTQCFTLLQIRPQTHLIGTLQSATQLPPLPQGQWEYSALSESVGRLSPLSFDLLRHLYQEARPTLQLIGHKAAQVDFMYRLPDGTIVVEPNKEKAFYDNTRMGSFWRGFKAPSINNQVLEAIKVGIDSTDFSLTRLIQFFSLWLASNSLSQGAGRDEVFDPQRYELLWLNPPPAFKPEITQDWNSLNRQIRTLFFNELHKLKLLIKDQPSAVFCTIAEFQQGQWNQIQRQHEQVQAASFDYLPLLQSAPNNTLQSLSVAKRVTGVVFKIDNPSQFRGDIPNGVILVAPYFDNRWVHRIKDLTGIIVERGSRLAHSTLVAREAQVPYVVIGNSSFVTLIANHTLTLDTIKNTFD